MIISNCSDILWGSPGKNTPAYTHCGHCLQPQFGMQKDLGAPESSRNPLQASQSSNPHSHQDSLPGQQPANLQPSSGHSTLKRFPSSFLLPQALLEVSAVAQLSSFYLGDKKVDSGTRSQSEGRVAFPKRLFSEQTMLRKEEAGELRSGPDLGHSGITN